MRECRRPAAVKTDIGVEPPASSGFGRNRAYIMEFAAPGRYNRARAGTASGILRIQKGSVLHDQGVVLAQQVEHPLHGLCDKSLFEFR